MMMAIEKAVRDGKNICCEAPNGFGKTVVTLAGVLPWVKENGGKVLYCARTHPQLDRVIEELCEISTHTEVTGVAFRGRHHMCLNELVIKNAETGIQIGEMCSYLRSEERCEFYERARTHFTDAERVFEAVNKRTLTAVEVISLAKRHGVCPYELAKRLARAVDVIALSYLYLFDPFIKEAILPELGISLANVVLVQDEAHNVPTIALEAASDALSLAVVRQALQEAVDYHDTISERFSRGLAQTMVGISEGLTEEEVIVRPQEIMDDVIAKSGLSDTEDPIDNMLKIGTRIRMGHLRSGRVPRSMIHRVGSFMSAWEEHANRKDYAFTISSTISSGEFRRVSLNQVALDPTSVTTPIIRAVRNTVAVSGTISPVEAYSDMLGFDKTSLNISFRSPFSSKNRIGIIVRGIDTSYEERSERVFRRLVEHCIAIADATPANMGIFTASYSVMKGLLEAGLQERLRKRLFIEQQGMSSEENDKMVEAFKREGHNEGAVLIGVQGGRNSEGGDFPGPTMNSVAVVGVPYARPNPRISALMNYYDERFNGHGRDYAYVLPAMTRAVQAAGRPVRTMTDRGAIVFLDQRFGTQYLKRFMPSWLVEVIEEVPDDPEVVSDRVKTFFGS